MILDWPALWGATPWAAGGIGGELVHERAVWGKAQGAGSDYRWLAMSAGFPAGAGEAGFRRLAELGRELNLGLEDRPEKSAYWRVKNGVAWAVAGYPSRAADASGRRGFFEKQIVQWCLEETFPAVAAALVLLPRVANFDDRVWWECRGDAEWTEPSFILTLDATACPPLAVSAADVEEALTAGLEELRACGLEEGTLASFYQERIGSSRPALLRGLAKPLSPRALATLLLPFSRPLADQLSLAGWIPSSRGGVGEWGERWHGVVLPRRLRASLPLPRPEDEARRMARALWRVQPELLGGGDRRWEDWTAALRRDLEGTTRWLIATGLWAAWRERARLQHRERLTTALAWLSSPAWESATSPAFETWENVLCDVSELTPPRLARLCPEGRPAWPWIPGREAEQIQNLEAMIRNADQRALFAARWRATNAPIEEGGRG